MSETPRPAPPSGSSPPVGPLARVRQGLGSLLGRGQRQGAPPPALPRQTSTAPVPTPGIPSPDAHLAYQHAVTQLRSVVPEVHDQFADHHDLGVRAAALETVHGALTHMHQELPWLRRLPQKYGLRVRLRGEPQVLPRGSVMGAYNVEDDGKPTLEINDKSNHTLWHEYGHFVDHGLNELEKNRSSTNLTSSRTPGSPMEMFAQSVLPGTASYKKFMDKVSRHGDLAYYGYMAKPAEAFARFFEQYMAHSHARTQGLPAPAPRPDRENYTPQELGRLGQGLRHILSHNAIALGKPFERAGDAVVHSGAPGYEPPVGMVTAPRDQVRESARPRVRLATERRVRQRLLMRVMEQGGDPHAAE